MSLRNVASSLLNGSNKSNSEVPTLQESIREAASGMAKHPKLEVAESAAYIRDMQHNMADQRDSIRRYEEKTVFGNDIPPRTQAAGDEMGNFIVCDDYHVDNSTRPSVSSTAKLPIIAAMGVALLAGYALMSKDAVAPSPPMPAVSQPAETPLVTPVVPNSDTRYNLEFIVN